MTGESDSFGFCVGEDHIYVGSKTLSVFQNHAIERNFSEIHDWALVLVFAI